MPASPERQGQFVLLEENLTEGTVEDRDLHPEERIVLANGEECKIEVKVRENEATVSIFNPDGSLVNHHWNPSQGEFSRSSRVPLNHGASIDPENKSLSVKLTEGGEKIRRTVFWKETDA